MKKSKWAKTKVTALLSIDYPIIQGPFGSGISSIALTTIVSNLGGMGSFGCQPYTAAEIVANVNAIRKYTDKPFNLNLWINDRDDRLKDFDTAAYQKLKTIFTPYFDELNIPFPEMPVDLGPAYEDQVEAILETKPPVFSFIYGIPAADILDKCRSNGTKIIGTATTVDEAIALENAGVDAIVATGFEAGGHRASFIRLAEESLSGTFSLVPQVADAVSIPVIAAGGIADARGIKAALALGADAVQIGTAFLATDQSNATEEHKQKLFSPEAKYTALSKVFSGRLARAVENKLTRELKGKEDLFAPYPMQRKLMNLLNKSSDSPYVNFTCGQAAPLLKYRDATILFNTLIKETDRLYS